MSAVSMLYLQWYLAAGFIAPKEPRSLDTSLSVSPAISRRVIMFFFFEREPEAEIR